MWALAVKKLVSVILCLKLLDVHLIQSKDEVIELVIGDRISSNDVELIGLRI